MDKKTLEEKFEEFARWYVLPLDKSEDGIYRALETQSAWAACQHQQAKVKELQKRVDLVKRELKAAKEGHYGFNDEGADIDGFIFDLEQALKGEGCQ